jgi:hypothetical protein
MGRLKDWLAEKLTGNTIDETKQFVKENGPTDPADLRKNPDKYAKLMSDMKARNAQVPAPSVDTSPAAMKKRSVLKKVLGSPLSPIKNYLPGNQPDQAQQ